MEKHINGEEVFRLPYGSAIIGRTSEGYTLEYSADGKNWEEADEVPANTSWVITGAPRNTYFRLLGNVDDNVAICA